MIEFEDRDKVIRDFLEDFDKRMEGDHPYPVPVERREEFMYVRERLQRFADLAPDEFVKAIEGYFEDNPDVLAKVMGEDADA